MQGGRKEREASMFAHARTNCGRLGEILRIFALERMFATRLGGYVARR